MRTSHVVAKFAFDLEVLIALSDVRCSTTPFPYTPDDGFPFVHRRLLIRQIAHNQAAGQIGLDPPPIGGSEAYAEAGISAEIVGRQNRQDGHSRSSTGKIGQSPNDFFPERPGRLAWIHGRQTGGTIAFCLGYKASRQPDFPPKGVRRPRTTCQPDSITNQAEPNTDALDARSGSPSRFPHR